MSRLSRERTATKKHIDQDRLPRALAHLEKMEALAPTAAADCAVQKNASGRYMALSGPVHPISVGIEGDTIEQARRFFGVAFGEWTVLARRVVDAERK